MDTGTSSRGAKLVRAVTAIVVVALGTTYTGGVVFGWVDETNRIDPVTLGVLALSAVVLLLLVNPEAIARFRNLEVGSFKLEVEAVKERQTQQAGELDDLRLVLALLLPPNERMHLVNLVNGTTSGYVGRNILRTELRRLRSIGLIETLDGRTVTGIPETALDLGDHVRLTDLGRRTLSRLQAIEEPGAPGHPGTG